MELFPSHSSMAFSPTLYLTLHIFGTCVSRRDISNWSSMAPSGGRQDNSNELLILTHLWAPGLFDCSVCTSWPGYSENLWGLEGLFCPTFMEVALCVKWRAQEVHSLRAQLSCIESTSFSLYVIVLVYFGCIRVGKVIKFCGLQIPHTSSTAGFSAEWLFLLPAHPFPCWMSRGDAGDIHRLFIWCITPLKQGNFSAPPGLAPQQSRSILRRARCGTQSLPA